jgi:hypothetical protein
MKFDFVLACACVGALVWIPDGPAVIRVIVGAVGVLSGVLAGAGVMQWRIRQIMDESGDE